MKTPGSPLEAILPVPVLAGSGNVSVVSSWVKIGQLDAGLWGLNWQVHSELPLHGVDVAFVEQPAPRSPFPIEGTIPLHMQPYMFTGLRSGYRCVRGPAHIYLRQTPVNYYIYPRRDFKAALYYEAVEPKQCMVESLQRAISVVHQLRSNGSWLPLVVPTPEPVWWHPNRVTLSSGYWQTSISPDSLYVHRLDAAGVTLTDIASITARGPLVWTLETYLPQPTFSPLAVSFAGGENRGPEQLIFIWEKP